jgi:hypothetical protein
MVCYLFGRVAGTGPPALLGNGLNFRSTGENNFLVGRAETAPEKIKHIVVKKPRQVIPLFYDLGTPETGRALPVDPLPSWHSLFTKDPIVVVALYHSDRLENRVSANDLYPTVMEFVCGTFSTLVTASMRLYYFSYVQSL